MKTNLRVEAEPTVVSCYAFFDKVFPACGLLDYTEGMYHNDPTTPYDVAQQNQIQYLLDEVECGPRSRILDVGCGNGQLVEAAAKRGAHVTGITISPEQVELCKHRGLDVRLLNYRNPDPSWAGKFDAVIANGPIEHFVQPREAIEHRDDAIYRHMFHIFHRLLNPRSKVRRLVNTTIHFLRPPDPQDLLAGPRSFRRGSDAFHWAMLARSFGGWYPTLGQFERCAAGRFRLSKTVDGTHDYHLTSEQWLERVRHEMRRLRTAPAMLWRSLPVIARHPQQCLTMLACMLSTQSWNWQFRGPNPPTCLLRQTWDYCEE